MKQSYLQSILLFAWILCISAPVLSQVGINTSTPRKMLEVNGDVQISGSIDVAMDPLKEGQASTFLIQDTDDSLKSLDVSNPTGAALGYIQEYVITNPNLDWVRDFDTGIDASEFVLITISAYFDEELVISTSANAIDNASLPYTATFIKNGTWHIIADYPMVANLDVNAIGTWTIKTLIFSKDLSKQFGTVNIPMGDGTTGSAVTPIIQ
ncbi:MULTISPECIES: hypothetical protein [Altibacter]|uniref:hypothetical protein n=1 Tax=Altibacter TaxID=1535231 RepID=UPI00054F29A7|nr:MULTISPECIES: hypothetical protein [Altibacter]MCW8981935.1 hypothetical protein [Altibacter sp.]MCW9036550.1 hypothetical protein [Altibacter sp.]